MTSIILNIFTVSTLLASIFSITSKNPVVSVLYLITTFVLAACYIMLSGINFIGISYIIVYVGAIAVLFLFIIMMINIRITDILETGKQYTKTLPLGLFIASLFIYIFFSIIPFVSNQEYLKFSFLNKDTANIVNNYIFSSDYNLLNFFDIDYFLSNADIITNNFLQIDSIGFNLYIYGAVLLMVCSIILLLAMFSAIIISSSK